MQPQTQSGRPVFVPAYGMAIAPEPEEPTPSEKIADSAAFSGLLAALGVPPGLTEIAEAAHHGVDAIDDDAPDIRRAPAQMVSPSGIRAQDELRLRRRAPG
jgi:hypothetical protein